MTAAEAKQLADSKHTFEDALERIKKQAEEGSYFSFQRQLPIEVAEKLIALGYKLRHGEQFTQVMWHPND